ncbi:MAG: L,D-transpeptidase family protein [Candidatus Tectomicrobia bacterium]
MNDTRPAWLWVGLLGCLMMIYSGAMAQEAGVQERLRRQTAQMRSTNRFAIDGAPIAAIRAIPAFYEQRQFQPAWTAPINIDALLDAVRDSQAEGLDPDDFHLHALLELRQHIVQRNAPAIESLAAFDLLMTDALLRLGYQLVYGKVNPEALDPVWNFDRTLLDNDPITLIQRAIEAGTVGTLLDDITLKHPVYQTWKAALARYRALQQSGGWTPVAEGPVLKLDMRDPRVAMLRHRLVSGNAPPSANPELFDAQLEAAVKSFQARHGLEADGIVGNQTLAALHVPVEARINQIRVNLERARWVLRNLDDDFIVVNIAGFRTYLVKDGEVVWSARAIVGKPYRKSPVFKANMTYLEFNPTWTVPPGILRKDILPKLKRDPAYLTQKQFRIVDHQGKRIDPSQIDWATVRRFPYTLVQEPGPNNALGLVKFMFPNKHYVYLHDTPSRGLFERSERTFSSGCIRVKNPFDLAELLLQSNAGWDRERIDRTVASGKRQTVTLSQSIPVLLLYWTVIVDPDGTVRFLQDVYQRDGAILAALEGDFKPSPPPVKKG